MRSILFLTLGLAACGGATDTELLNPPDQGTDSGLQKDTSVTTSEAGAKDTSSADSTVIPEAGPDTSPPPPSLKIQCGNNQCNVGMEVCCRSGFGSFSYKCVANAGQCQGSGSIVLECSNAASCPNMSDVCCAPLVQQGQAFVASGTHCTSANQCSGQNNVIVCDPQAMNNCPNGGNCSMSSITLPSYNICK